MSTRLTQRVVPKAASYSVVYPMDAPGTIFTNRGATGAVTFTLQAPSRQLLGTWYEFVGVADQNIIVAGKTAGDVVTLDDVAADSVAAQTGSQKIGARIRAACIESVAGTYKWLVTGEAVGVTYTVAT